MIIETTTQTDSYEEIILTDLSKFDRIKYRVGDEKGRIDAVNSLGYPAVIVVVIFEGPKSEVKKLFEKIRKGIEDGAIFLSL